MRIPWGQPITALLLTWLLLLLLLPRLAVVPCYGFKSPAITLTEHVGEQPQPQAPASQTARRRRITAHRRFAAVANRDGEQAGRITVGDARVLVLRRKLLIRCRVLLRMRLVLLLCCVAVCARVVRR